MATADPRLRVTYREIAPVYVTFKIDNSTITYDSTKAEGSAQVGLCVNFSANDTVQLADDAQMIAGVLKRVQSDNYCTVQIGGTMLLPKGNAATLTYGYKVVGAQGAAAAKGYARQVAVATLAEVAVARGFILTDSFAGQLQNAAATLAAVWFG